MIRKPNPLLNEFLDKSLDMPGIDWETRARCPRSNPIFSWGHAPFPRRSVAVKHPV